MNDSGGARIQEGVASLVGYADIFLQNTLASGIIPQISAILGPCAGGAVYSPALTDFVFMARGTSNMFVTGPEVVKAVTHEEVTFEELGGAAVHAEKSGVCHVAAESEADTLYLIRKLLSYLPQNYLEDPPFLPNGDDLLRTDEALDSIIPEDPGKPYDVKEIIRRVVDNGQFFEIHEAFAQNIVIGFARLGGHSVGIVANQPQVLGGVLDIDASEKAARFVRFCDAFNIPIVTLWMYLVHARTNSGTWWYHPVWSKITLCILRSYRPKNDNRPAESIWWSLYRHVQQALAWRY